MNPDILGLLIGMLVGALVWVTLVRPRQLRAHERRRRAAGLPPHRHLPEDSE